MVIALLTTILFGWLPPSAPLASLQRRRSSRPAGIWREPRAFQLRRGLVVSQVAFSLVLLVGAMLFVRSLKNILSVDAGFQTAGIMEADLDFSQLKIPAPQRQTLQAESD